MAGGLYVPVLEQIISRAGSTHVCVCVGFSVRDGYSSVYTFFGKAFYRNLPALSQV